MSQGIAYRAGLGFLASSVPGADTPETLRWCGQFYQRSGPSYRPVTDEALESQLTKWLAGNPEARKDTNGKVLPVTRTFLRDAMLAVRSEPAVADQVAAGSWLREPPAGAAGPFLATPAGVLDLGRLGDSDAPLLADDPNFFTLAALPVTPDLGTPCPAWSGFLAETFPDDEGLRQVLQEAFGYCLWPDCRFET